MELWMMKLQGVLARAKPHDQLLIVEVLDSLLESLAPDTAKECLSSLAGRGAEEQPLPAGPPV